MLANVSVQTRGELRSAVLLAGVSGAVATGLHVASHDNDVRHFYLQKSRVMYAVYMLCVFVIWFSFALNARFAVVQLAKLCISTVRGSGK